VVLGILLPMGKNNQQRRSARRRQRSADLAAARARSAPEQPMTSTPGGQPRASPKDQPAGLGPTEPKPPPASPRRAAGRTEPKPPPTRARQVDHELEIARLFATGAVHAFGPDADEHELDHVVQTLIMLQVPGRELLSQQLASTGLLRLVGLAWESGWQPLDLVHIVRRHQGAGAAALVTAVIFEQAQRERAVDRAPGDWVAQLRSLGIDKQRAGSPPGGNPKWLVGGWQFAHGIGMWDGWRDVLRLFGQLQLLRGLTPLGPPPSHWDRARASATAREARLATGVSAAIAGRSSITSRPVEAGGEPIEHDPRMLGKIRALLSKAEATTFAEEADTYTAKAQDLMTRYAIDEALLEESAGNGEVIIRRIHIDNPYAQAKVQLLSIVGDINRVRVIWDDHHGMATVVGMAVDLQLVELLFTSLLVQATRALTEAGNVRTTQAGYRSGRMNRAPAFRRAFLLSYAHRIGERLEAAIDQATAESSVSHGAELVPVLQRRAEAVDQTFARLFPQTGQIRAKRVDARGWDAGRTAADRAVFLAGQVECA
jgi:hypothetical protein